MTLMNGDRFPDLSVQVVDGPPSTVAELVEGCWAVVLFYRDEQCPKCQAYFDRVAAVREQVARDSLQVIAISADTESGARATRDQHGLWFPVVHSAPLSWGEDLGLYTNPDRGCFEPGFFVLDPDLRVVHVSVQSGPAARPAIEELLVIAANSRAAAAAS